MNRLLFYPIAAVMALLQSLPLSLVAWLGRRCGDLAWWLDWHHRRQTLVNLDIAFGDELSRASRERIGRENFRLLGEAWLCALETSAMERGEVARRLQVVGLNKIRPWIERSEVPGVVIAIGHFGNIEMYDFAARDLPWMEMAAVYRRSRSPLRARILARVRRDCRCRFFEEGSDGKALRTLLREGNVVLGLMCDFNPGPDGVSVPFFGLPAATSAAPAVYALRYRMPLHAVVCFRTNPGQWRVEVSDEIPTRVDGRPRAIADILVDLNSYLETSIRRDPANWYWAQPRWEHRGQPRDRRQRLPS